MATKDELNNERDLNKAKAEGNKFSRAEAQAAAERVDYTRQLNADLKDQLGVRQRLTDQETALRDLGKDVVDFARKNVVELGNQGKIQKNIADAQIKQNQLTTERQSLINSIGGDSAKLVGYANELADLLNEQQLKGEANQKLTNELIPVNEKVLDFQEQIKNAKSDQNDLTKELQNLETGLEGLTGKQLEAQQKKIQAQKDSISVSNNAIKSLEDQLAPQLALQAAKEDTLNIAKAELGAVEGSIERIKKQVGLGNMIDAATATRLATVVALSDAHDVTLGRMMDEEKIQSQINDRVGVTGAIVEGVGGIMQRLGMRSGIFDDAMKGAKLTMDSMAEKSVRVLGYELNEAGEKVPIFEENFNKTQIAIAGAIKLSEGFRQALFDPLTLSLAILDAFLDVDKAASDLQQKIGVNTSEFVAQNDALATSVQQMQLMSDLADETGRNVASIFTPQQIGEAAELQNLLGLSADQAGSLAIIAQEAGRSVGDTADNIFEQVDAFNKVNRTAISGNAVLKDIGDASFDIKASFLAFPDGIAEAATAAKRLGMNLDDVNNIADSLMDFESSIQNELEAQLLTGKQINMAKAREFALSNDLAGLSNEIFKNSVDVAEYGEMNRIQQQALAKSMGISTEQLAKMAYQRGLDAKMTDEQLKAATGLTRADYERMSAQETMQVALGKLAQAFAPILDVVGNVASALAAIITPAAKLVGLITSTTIGKIGIVALAAARAAGILNISLSGVKKALTQNIVAQKAYNIVTGIGNTLKGAYISLTTSETAVTMRAAIAKRASNAADFISNNVKKAGLILQNTIIGKFLLEKAALIASTVAKYASIGATAAQSVANTTLATSQTAVATTGAAAGGGMAAAGAGLGAFGAAAAPAIPIILAIGLALLMASPAIYAFGIAIKSAFEGVASIVTAVGGAITGILKEVTLEKAAALVAAGLAFGALGIGLASLGASLIFGAAGIGVLGAIALMGPGLKNAGDGMEKMAAGVKALSEALKTLEVEKLDNLQDFTVKAAVAGIAAGGLGAIGEMVSNIAGDGAGENDELLARVDQLIAAVEQDRVTKVYMNGNQMSMQLVQENPRQG